jgi:HSP20 family protein
MGSVSSAGAGRSAGVSGTRADQERELRTSREDQGNMRPSASRQRGATGQQGSGQWAPVFTSGSPFAMMRRMMEDMDRLFSDFGFSHPGVLASSFLNPGAWAGGQPRNAIGSGSPGGQTTQPLPSRPGLERGGRQGISPASISSLWTPQVEVFERGNNLVVRADLPGLSLDDVDVEVDDDALIIRGERHSDLEDEQEGYYRSERSYGSFYRAIPLPDNIDASQCKATFKEGVLEVTLPKPRQQSRAKKIDVSGS